MMHESYVTFPLRETPLQSLLVQVLSFNKFVDRTPQSCELVALSPLSSHSSFATFAGALVIAFNLPRVELPSTTRGRPMSVLHRCLRIHLCPRRFVSTCQSCCRSRRGPCIRLNCKYTPDVSHVIRCRDPRHVRNSSLCSCCGASRTVSLSMSFLLTIVARDRSNLHRRHSRPLILRDVRVFSLPRLPRTPILSICFMSPADICVSSIYSSA